MQLVIFVYLKEYLKAELVAVGDIFEGIKLVNPHRVGGGLDGWVGWITQKNSHLSPELDYQSGLSLAKIVLKYV